LLKTEGIKGGRQRKRPGKKANVHYKNLKHTRLSVKGTKDKQNGRGTGVSSSQKKELRGAQEKESSMSYGTVEMINERLKQKSTRH